MNIAWISAGQISLQTHGDTLGMTVTHSEPEAGSIGNADALIVNANGGFNERATRLGLHWLQRFVRETRSRLPTLIYSFESREHLSVDFPVLATDWAGIRFLRLPFTNSDLKQAVISLEPLNESQLSEYLRWYCDLQSEWREMSHDLSAKLSDWPANRVAAEQVLNTWVSSVLTYAPDQKAASDHLQRVFGTASNEVREAIQQLEDGLCSRIGRSMMASGSRTLPEAPERRPPSGFSTIMIADDQGYEQSTIRSLQGLGYQLSQTATNLEEAENLIRYWCPRVVLADLNFPSRDKGRRLIQSALNSKCLVIAISRARVAPGELPTGVEDCSGGLDFQDAERIHRLIWRYALSEGV